MFAHHKGAQSDSSPEMELYLFNKGHDFFLKSYLQIQKINFLVFRIFPVYILSLKFTNSSRNP